MKDHQPVLQAASAHALSTNQNQRLSLERRHLCHFLIDLQLVSVKLCLKEGTINDQSKMSDTNQQHEQSSHLHSWLSGTSSSSSSFQLWFHRGSLQNETTCVQMCAGVITTFGQKRAGTDLFSKRETHWLPSSCKSVLWLKQLKSDRSQAGNQFTD